MSQVATTDTSGTEKSSIFARSAARYGVEPNKISSILKNTIFKGATDEQVAALLIVAEQFNLNPFVKEIYAFPDKGGGIVPLVGIDGWYRIVNESPQLDGFEFRYAEATAKVANKDECPEWIECIIYRKDRTRPIIVREYMEECYKSGTNGPWQSHPRCMLRHKAFIQAARMAFGFSGIYDEDEGQRIADARVVAAESNMAAPIDVEASPAVPALPPAARFEVVLQDMGIVNGRRQLVEEYSQYCEQSFKSDRETVIQSFLAREEEFKRIYPQWEKARLEQLAQEQSAQKPKRKHREKPAEATPAPVQTEQSLLQENAPQPAETTAGEALVNCPKTNPDGSQRIVTTRDCAECADNEGCPMTGPVPF